MSLNKSKPMKTNPALSALRHNVTGAIARGEAQAITEIPVPTRPEHTPGPWTVDNQYIHGPDGIRFLAVAGDGAGQANARLIASAPELLAACMSALRALEDNIQPGPMDEDAKTGLREAIAKATGGAE